MNSFSQNHTIERIFIHNVDLCVNPFVLYIDYEGSHRLEVSRSSPGKGLTFIGLSGGRACYQDNKNHSFVIWNVMNQVVEASIQERPSFHQGERGSFGFSYTRRGDSFFIVRLQIPLLHIRKEDPQHVSAKCWVDSFRSDTKIWTRRTIDEGPFSPLVDPGLAAQSVIFWKGSIFVRDLIIEYDFENHKVRTLNLPKPAHGQLTSLRLGFGYRGEVVASTSGSHPT
ncbi:hypothetical protein M0R45_009283 [Rubus argutus]|uniref:Uncharacterized protein n=1 Tax=Rubus argutus TaxID=59490 RepID=A0AAW1Y7H0_RUBAR